MAREPKKPGEKPEESKVAEDQTPAIEHPRRIRRGVPRYEDRALRPDRIRGGYDKK